MFVHSFLSMRFVFLLVRMILDTCIQQTEENVISSKREMNPSIFQKAQSTFDFSQ